MPIERSKLSNVLRTIPINYFGDSFTVTYRPDAMTPAKSAEMARLRHLAEAERNGLDGHGGRNSSDTAFDEAARNAEELAAQLADIIVSWDVVEDGETVPLDKENLMTFPNAVLGHIMTAIGEDLSPKVKTYRR